MVMRRHRRLTWLSGLLLPVVLLLAGCEYPDAAGGEATNDAGVGQSATGTGGCADAGPGVRQWLPVLDPSDGHLSTIRVRENPCLPFGDLLGLVDDVIPDEGVPDMATDRVGEFREHVGGAADRFLAAEDAVECGYETDGLAIVVYQHADHPWSVGLVVVVRLSVDAVIDAGLCYLGKQLGLDEPGYSTRSDGNQPHPEFCGLAAQPGDYAVVALGTSNWMCAALATSPAGLVRVL
jgi:hypothetical protein